MQLWVLFRIHCVGRQIHPTKACLHISIYGKILHPQETHNHPISTISATIAQEWLAAEREARK